jgi:2-methylcitrate dehydratase
MPCHIAISLHDGQTLAKEKEDYEGFHTRPMPWPVVLQKFERLAAPHTDPGLRGAIAEAVANLESIRATELTALLSKVRRNQ